MIAPHIASAIAHHLASRPDERPPILWDREIGAWWEVRSSARGWRLTRQTPRQRLIVVHTAPDRIAMIAYLRDVASQADDK